MGLVRCSTDFRFFLSVSSFEKKKSFYYSAQKNDLRWVGDGVKIDFIQRFTYAIHECFAKMVAVTMYIILTIQYIKNTILNSNNNNVVSENANV